jgi:hypothetical protein
MIRVFVAGAGGFTGQHLVSFPLRKQGYLSQRSSFPAALEQVTPVWGKLRKLCNRFTTIV